ncbi:MAG: DNA helicase RecG, partial [Haemophilus parainfluenzae]
GQKVRVFGKLTYGPQHQLQMIHPRVYTRFPTELSPFLTPIYPSVKGLSQSTLQALIKKAFQIVDLHELLPKRFLDQQRLPDFKNTLYAIHFAKKNPLDPTCPALRRLKLDELLAQQLSLRLLKKKRQVHQDAAIAFTGALAEKLRGSLPYPLTAAQERVLSELNADLAAPTPMHRLLQGDVGAGKTIVSALLALNVLENSGQVALLAPTELLAEQHYEQFKNWLDPLGIHSILLTGQQKKKEKESLKNEIATGKAMIAIGTHALLQKDVQFQALKLIIIDEQHRFGVKQRLALKEKGSTVNQLMMSATPIPRTLAMTYFADVELSRLDELPPNRTPVKTILANEGRREEVENFMEHKLLQGTQAYWVCPLIEESEALELQTALDTYAHLKDRFPKLHIGLVHGKLKAQEKKKVMDAFVRGDIQLLVATTVIEVGIHVANASLMIIEHAERMGLFQLHQLRGRVGRGEHMDSACVLLYGKNLSREAKERLKSIYSTQDGFKLAEIDLTMRGPGEFLGAKQSGVPLPRFANLEEDGDLLNLARDLSEDLLHHYPKEISEQHLERWLPNKEAYLGV